MGPLLGGLLSNPYERFSWKGPGGVFVKYPYLLPCILSTCYNIIVCVLSWWSLDETNQKMKNSKIVTDTAPKSDSAGLEAAGEQEPLLRPSENEQPKASSKKAVIGCVVGIA